MGWTFSFFSDVCSFLSSVPEDLWTFLVFLLGVPLPLSFFISLGPQHFEYDLRDRGKLWSVMKNVEAMHTLFTHCLVNSCKLRTMNAEIHNFIGRTNSHLRLHALELLLIHVGRVFDFRADLLRMA